MREHFVAPAFRHKAKQTEMPITNTTKAPHEPEKKVVVMMTDMVGYSSKTSAMSPEELKKFIVDYHYTLRNVVITPENQPVELEPSAGDGALVIFKQGQYDNEATICTRAVQTAIKVAQAITDQKIHATRMGLFLGTIVEADLFGKSTKFSTCFAVAKRLEELCEHFGTTLLMDREVARKQQQDQNYLVNIGKFSITSVPHPMNVYSVYKPGINGCPKDIDEQGLEQFINKKNEAMDDFSGNILAKILPNFPKARAKLMEAQAMFTALTGQQNQAVFRILEYIREYPYPNASFNACGMMLTEKKRDILGDRLYHLSKQLLRAMDYKIYHALIVDTSWEQKFKLQWHNKGDTIISIDDPPNGVYYLDSGIVTVLDRDENILATMEEGAIFGEIAYFDDQQKRTATVIAKSDVVVRKISTTDLHNLPIIMELFGRIAKARQKDMADR